MQEVWESDLSRLNGLLQEGNHPEALKLLELLERNAGYAPGAGVEPSPQFADSLKSKLSKAAFDVKREVLDAKLGKIKDAIIDLEGENYFRPLLTLAEAKSYPHKAQLDACRRDSYGRGLPSSEMATIEDCDKVVEAVIALLGSIETEAKESGVNVQPKAQQLRLRAYGAAINERSYYADKAVTDGLDFIALTKLENLVNYASGVALKHPQAKQLQLAAYRTCIKLSVELAVREVLLCKNVSSWGAAAAIDALVMAETYAGELKTPPKH